MKTNKRGFTLIELLIAVTIVGILAAITYPSYRNSIVKSRRAEAQGALASFANAMSQWYLENNSSYLGAAIGDADTGPPKIFPSTVPISGGTTTYNLTISAVSRNTFTLQAIPTGNQEGDGFLELNEMGTKSCGIPSSCLNGTSW
jgi:type IV pilus assembly protein PilE